MTVSRTSSVRSPKSDTSLPRSGPALWDETVSEAEKGRRLETLIALQERIGAEINAGWVGREVEVLVEGPARRPEGWLAGKTREFKTAVFAAGAARVGDLVRVRVTDSTAHTLIG